MKTLLLARGRRKGKLEAWLSHVGGTKDIVELLSDPDESRPLADLLDGGGANVGAAAPHAPEDVEEGVVDGSSVRNGNGLAL